MEKIPFYFGFSIIQVAIASECLVCKWPLAINCNDLAFASSRKLFL